MKDAINEYYIENGKTLSTDYWENEKGNNIVYEVLRIIDGKPLFFKGHYDRMVNSCKLIDKTLPISSHELRKDIDLIVKKNKVECGNIKITINYEKNTIRVFFIKHSYPSDEMYKDGVKTILYYGERNNPNAKIINNEFRSRVVKKIQEANAFEAILVNNKGEVTEGSKSNIFFIMDEILYTSRVEDVLPGVTRDEIISIAKRNGIEVIEENIKAIDIEKYDAMFISGTSPNILPICKVEEVLMDVNNSLLRRLMELIEREVINCI